MGSSHIFRVGIIALWLMLFTVNASLTHISDHADEVVWSVNLSIPTGSGLRVQYVGATSILSAKLYIYGDRKGGLTALRRASGDVVWNLPGGNGINYGILAVRDDYLFLAGPNNHRLRCYNVNTGVELWGLGQNSGGPSGLLFSDDGALVTSDFANHENAHVVAQYYTANGSQVWQQGPALNDVANARCVPGVIGIMGGALGSLGTFGYSLEDGAVVWQAPTVYGTIFGCWNGMLLIGNATSGEDNDLLQVTMVDANNGAVSSVTFWVPANVDSGVPQDTAVLQGDLFCAQAPVNHYTSSNGGTIVACYDLTSGMTVFNTTFTVPGIIIFANSDDGSSAYVIDASDSSSGSGSNTQFTFSVTFYSAADGSVVSAAEKTFTSQTVSLGVTTQLGSTPKVLVSPFDQFTGMGSVMIFSPSAKAPVEVASGLPSLDTLRMEGVQYDAGTRELFLLTKNHGVKLSGI